MQAIIPSISGMVKIPEAENLFLVTHDAKGFVGPRLGVIALQSEGPHYHTIDIHNWPSSEHLPNDIEGICAIPGRPGEYLLAESGFYPKHGNFGRILKIRYPGGSVAGAEYLGSFRPLPPPPDNSDTPKHEQVEGITAVAYGSTMALLLALRGHKKELPGQLVWGTLIDTDKSEPRFTPIGKPQPLSPGAIADRGAADLFARARVGSTNEWEVLSVATVDSGDLGPFLSAVYLAGTLTITSTGGFEFNANKEPSNVLWHIQGLKVEALAAPADLLGTSELSIATDDEFYQGIWRPLAPSKGPQVPSKMLFVENVLAAAKLR